ncbi:hypothetical protein ACTXOU_00595 [Psychrobacter glacincola]
MSFIRLCTLALIATSSLAACSSYEQANINNKTSVSQIKDSTAFVHSIKPSHSDAIIGQVTSKKSLSSLKMDRRIPQKSVKPTLLRKTLIKCRN